MKQFSLKWVIVTLLAVGFLSACGGAATQAPASGPAAVAGATAASSEQPTSGPNAGSSDACSLLTQQQVSDAAGVDMASGERLVPTSPRICTWAEAGSDSADSQQVTLTLLTATEFENGKTPSSALM